MTIIGLCGGSGSGKGTVCSFFEAFGIPSIDADSVYRDLTVAGAQLLDKLTDAFGESIIKDDGTLDRRMLSKIVFSDSSGALLLKLNSITHTAILEETEARISRFNEQKFPAVIFDAPLLFESGFDKKCDIIVAVVAPYETRIERIMQRDRITKEEAERRIRSQISDEILRKRADYIIENDCPPEQLRENVKVLKEKILNEEVYDNE